MRQGDAGKETSSSRDPFGGVFSPRAEVYIHLEPDRQTPKRERSQVDGGPKKKAPLIAGDEKKKRRYCYEIEKKKDSLLSPYPAWSIDAKRLLSASVHPACPILS